MIAIVFVVIVNSKYL